MGYDGCVFICYLMIIQNLYLRDMAPSILHFMTPSIVKGYESIVEGNIQEGLDILSGLIAVHPGSFNLQGGLSFVIIILVTFIILIFVVFSLNRIAKHCQDRALEQLNFGHLALYSEEDIDQKVLTGRAQEMNRWPAAWPKVNTLLWLSGVSVLCIVFYKVGLFFVGLLVAYLVVRVFRLINHRPEFPVEY